MNILNGIGNPYLQKEKCKLAYELSTDNPLINYETQKKKLINLDPPLSVRTL
jgi:hypothetical protein